MKQKIPIQRVQADTQRFFMGETATCVMCGKTHKFHPRISSNWTVVEVDGKPYYVCPDELPLKGRGGTEDQFAAAYEKNLCENRYPEDREVI